MHQPFGGASIAVSSSVSPRSAGAQARYLGTASEGGAASERHARTRQALARFTRVSRTRQKDPSSAQEVSEIQLDVSLEVKIQVEALPVRSEGAGCLAPVSGSVNSQSLEPIFRWV